MSKKQTNTLKTIFERFGCSDEKELYQKVKMAIDCPELIEHIKIAGEKLEECKPQISDKNDYLCCAMGLPMPGPNEIQLIHANANMTIQGYQIFSVLNTNQIYHTMRKIVADQAVNAFIMCGEVVHRQTVDNLIANLAAFQINTADTARYLQSYRQIEYGKDRYWYEKMPQPRLDKSACEKFMKQVGYQEFVEYYMSREVIGLHINEDKDTLVKLLKIGYQGLAFEKVGIVIIDKNKRVLGFEEASRGGVDWSLVDNKILFSKLISYPDAKYFIAIHNHPSGRAVPSKEDVQMTNGLAWRAGVMDYEMIDHVIITKSQVVSVCQQMNMQHWIDKTNDNMVFEPNDRMLRDKVATLPPRKSKKFLRGELER